MTLEWGRPKSPGAYVTSVLIPLGFPVGPEGAMDASGNPIACYKVTELPGGKADRITLNALVQVDSLATDTANANGRAAAAAMASDADHALMSMNDWDMVTLPDGTTAYGTVECHMTPSWHDYRDPLIKSVVARYEIEMRFELP